MAAVANSFEIKTDWNEQDSLTLPVDAKFPLKTIDSNF